MALIKSTAAGSRKGIQSSVAHTQTQRSCIIQSFSDNHFILVSVMVDLAAIPGTLGTGREYTLNGMPVYSQGIMHTHSHQGGV